MATEMRTRAVQCGLCGEPGQIQESFTTENGDGPDIVAALERLNVEALNVQEIAWKAAHRPQCRYTEE